MLRNTERVDTGAARPEVSLVVASFSGPEMLEKCLESVALQDVRPEVNVVTTSSAVATSDLKRRYKTFRFFHVARDTNVFQMRAIGALKARGQMLAFTEDHCVAERGWLSALQTAYQERDSRVVGGSVDFGTQKGLYNWSLFLCEYAQYMSSPSASSAPILSGVNVAYDRNLLLGCREVWGAAMYENELHDALFEAGHQLRCVKEARVRSNLTMPIRQSLVHLFTGGLRFGMYRQTRSTPVQRLFWIASASAVPLVLGQRIVRQVLMRQPKRVALLLASMPYLSTLLAAWSLGEALGILRASFSSRLEEATGEG